MLAFFVASAGAILFTRYARGQEQTVEQPAPQQKTNTSLKSSDAIDSKKLSVVMSDDDILESTLDSIMLGQSPSTPPQESATKQTYDFYDCCTVDDDCECKYGFKRPDFKKKSIEGTAGGNIDKQIFVCLGVKSTDWPANVEDLPIIKAVKAALKAHKTIKIKVCGIDDTPSKENTIDLLVFPDMMRFNAITALTVQPLFDSYFGKQGAIPQGVDHEKIKGTHIFVCCHHARDKKCSTCGPRIYKEFVDQIPTYSGQVQDAGVGPVVVHRVSHIGGHKYAGNIIIYRYFDNSKRCMGDWYGFINTDDVKSLYERAIIKGEIISGIWRGRTGIDTKVAKKFVVFSQQ